MDRKRNVLTVYAHQEPKSFNGALKDIAEETFEGQGHKVFTSDLYEMKFNPVASKDTFKERKNTESFEFQEELRHAAESGNLPDDIKQEVQKILFADLIVLQFPLYWLGMPAILKGWIDRCLPETIAFDLTKFKWFENGPFVDKKLMLSFTTGGTEKSFSNKGIFGDMNVMLWSIQNSLRMTGLQILAPQISYAPADASENQRAHMLQSWRSRLQTIWSEEPLEFVNVKHFDQDDGYQLSNIYLSNLKASDPGPTPGQNIGRAFISESMTCVVKKKKAL